MPSRFRIVIAAIAALSLTVTAVATAVEGDAPAAGSQPSSPVTVVDPPADVDSPAEVDSPADTAFVDVPRSSDPSAWDPPPGGDVRVVLDAGAVVSPVEPRGLRRVWGGWRGYHQSIGGGVTPASFTVVALRGRWSDDWLDGGLDLLAASSPAPGTVLVPVGPDLSLRSVHTAEWPIFTVSGPAPLELDLRPLRRPAEIPFARVTALNGPHGRSVLGVEFDRTFRWGVAATGFLEIEDGDAPSGVGAYDIDRMGGSGIVSLPGGWTGEIGGIRTSAARSRGVPGAHPSSIQIDLVRSDYFVRGSVGDISAEYFHTQSWVESAVRGPAVETASDGLSAAVGVLGPLDSARVQFARHSASGGLLSGSRDAVSVRAEVSRDFPLGARAVSATAGISALGDDVVPLAAAAMSAGPSEVNDWRLYASFAGRHPTAAELALDTLTVPVSSGAQTFVAGNTALRSEQVFTAGASLSRSDVLSGVGGRGEFTTVLDPIVLRSSGGEQFTPDNADAETGSSLVLWADAGDSSRLTGRLDLGFRFIDADGALNSHAPVPSVAATVSASLPLSLFDDYLHARLSAAVVHESGLARGPWSDQLEDSRLTLSLGATGAVGSARLFAMVENVLSGDGPRVPGMEPDAAAFTAGLSWLFRD